MYLKELQIRNYKSFSKARFKFNKGVNVILGENDSGKTNSLQALRLVLDKHLNWYEREISEKMFSESLSSWKGQMIIISLRFADIDATKEEQAVLKYITGNKDDEGSMTWFCLPDKSLRKSLSSAANKEEMQKILEKVTIDNYMTIITCGAYVDYLDDSIYLNMVGDLENGQCNYTEKLDESYYGYYGSDSYNGIDYIRNKLIDFTYIDALRDTVSDMKQKYNPLMTMLRQIEPRISSVDKENVKTLIDDVNGTIGGVTEVKQLSESINKKIVESVGNTYAPDIVLKSELSSDIKDIFRNLKLKSKHQQEFDIDNIGLGSTNIIYIALKLLEYSFIKELDNLQSKYFLLLFEEPEAHLHKHIQMSLFEKTGIDVNDNVQVILTTHSDNISAASKISSMNVIIKQNNESKVVQPYTGLKKEEITHIERYLDVKRSELLFSKSVILIEGDAEEIIIPIMVKKCFGLSLDELGISLINIGSVGFENVYKLFHADRITKKCAIISDLDTPIDVSDTHQNNAFSRGKKRKSDIELESKTNSYVRGFFGTYTFEVELVCGNENYYESLIEETYTDPKVVADKKIKIQSKDVKEYGDAALKIASYNKKGWNAILLSETIDGKFHIPDYVLNALFFVAKDELMKTNNYLVTLHKYGEVYNDVILLDKIKDGDISLEDALKSINTENINASAIRLLSKCGGLND